MRLLTQAPLKTGFGLVVLLLVVLVLGRAYLGQKQGGNRSPAPLAVVVASAGPQAFTETIQAIGTTRALESVEITAKVTDTVRTVHFTDGMMVKKGDVLVELASDEDTAALAEAQATLDEARQQFDRIRVAVETSDMPQFEHDKALATLKIAEARVQRIRARLADRIIRAPFSGVLGFRQVSPGAMVSASTVITTLDDLHKVNVDFSIPETFIASLQPGQVVEARSAAYPDRVFLGTVATVGSRVDPVTRAVVVRTVLNNDGNLLRPGMLMTIELIKNRGDALAIPEEALVPVEDRQFVFVVDEESRARRTEVEIGRRRSGVVELVHGVPAGTNVIIRGTSRVQDGQLVRVAGDDAKTGPDQAAVRPGAGKAGRPVK